MKKIFIINCNPKGESLKAPYLNAYIEQVQKNGNEIRTVNVYNLKLEYLKFVDEQPDYTLTEELKEVQDSLVWADQIVFSYPIWWFAIPAKLKSFIEIVFQEGIVSNMGKHGPVPLMKDKTAVIFQSYDMPYFAMKYFYGDVPMKFWTITLTSWCGIKIEKRFDFDCISSASEKTKQKWLREIKIFASKVK